ncbi:MAG: flavodoxin family protein [Chloroflexota bacterium]
MLQVLGLWGSPRWGGNSELLLDKALAGAQSQGAVVEKIVLNDLDIRPCQHCDGCLHTGLCIVDDDMQPLHHKLIAADRLILSAPIFFMGLPAQAKVAVDRCQALWVTKYLLKRRHPYAKDGSRRRGLWLGVGGRTGPNRFDASRATVQAFFATCDVTYEDELLYPGVDAYQEILKHPTALEEAYAAGRRFGAEISPSQPPKD